VADWRLAPTLVVLRNEINKAYPLRDKTSDGSLGNASHSSRLSDHNPDSRRVVCAIDVDEDLKGSANKVYPRFNSGQPAKAALVDRLLTLAKAGKLPQLRYVIYERKIYQARNGFAARAYTGPNAHDHHVHVSVYHEPRHADRKAPWNLVAKPNPRISLNGVQIAITGALSYGDEGKEYQRALNRFTAYKLVVDGILGKNTRRSTALAQLKVAQGNGAKLTKADAWPNKGHHPDLDGIPGRELFSNLGIDNSDPQEGRK
jgi:hypothetical protein